MSVLINRTVASSMRLLAVGLWLLAPTLPAFGQASPSPAPASPTPTASPSAAPSAVPLADVVAAADAATERLDRSVTEIAGNQTGSNIARDLSHTMGEIDARIDETKRLLAPGVPLETTRDLEIRWLKLSDQFALWTRQLTDLATALDHEIAQLPELRSTWHATLELARSSAAPPELTKLLNSRAARSESEAGASLGCISFTTARRRSGSSFHAVSMFSSD
jgi:hypothetical protein